MGKLRSTGRSGSLEFFGRREPRFSPPESCLNSTASSRVTLTVAQFSPVF